MKVLLLDDDASRSLVELLRLAEIGLRRGGGRLPAAWVAAKEQLSRSGRVRTALEGSDLGGAGGGGESEPVPGLLTIAEVAEVARLSESAVKRLVAEGRLRVVHIGRSVRVHPTDLAAFLDGLRKSEVS